VHVGNVYNERVTINNVTNNRVSFNGEGGILAKPTAEEDLAGHEPHERPTKLQLDHNRAASISAGAFASTNHGKPAVAATVRPAALTGSGVVRAKSGGAMAPLAPAGAETPKTDIAPEKEKTKAPGKLERKNEMKPEAKPEAEKPKVEKAPVEKTQERDQHREGDQHKEKSTPEKPREEPKAPPEKTQMEPKASPDKAREEPKMRPPPMERKPEGPRPGAQESKCGHPGEPACH
jgi:hypothetical protein